MADKDGDEIESASSMLVSDCEITQPEHDHTSQDDEDDTDTSFLFLKNCRDWLEQQKLDYEAELHTRRTMEQEELDVNQNTEPNHLKLYESISILQHQLLDVSCRRSTKKLVLERLLSSHLKMKKLFPPDEEGLEETDSRNFTDQCEEQNELNKDILKYHKALKEELLSFKEVQREQIDVMKTNVELMKRLKELKDDKEKSQREKETKAEARIQKQISTHQDMTTVITNIFQVLIVGGGSNWAADDELRDMVLNFGKCCT